MVSPDPIGGVRGRGAADEVLRGLRPWSQPRVDEAGWTGGRMPVPADGRKQDTPIWRPPGPSEGRAVMRGSSSAGALRGHRPPPPPPHAVEPPAGDKSTEILADELRKSAAILAQAQAQMAEERQLSQLRAREAEAQLGEAVELGRQEERHRSQQAVRDANDSLSALAEANEQGAAFVKRVERAHIAGALAEQRRSLEHEINESRLATEHELSELQHIERERHANLLRKLTEELDEERAARVEAEERVRVLDDKFSQTKEGRIAAAHARSVRRMLRSGLAKGWTQWQSTWEAKRYHQTLINRTQGQFFHLVPSLKGGFYLWVGLRDARNTRRIEKRAEEAADLTGAVAALEAQLVEEGETAARKLKAAAAEVEEMRKMLVAFETDKREREMLMEARMEDERQARIQQLATTAGRRVQNVHLHHGWATWAGQYRQYREEARLMKLMRQVKNRLHKPALAEPFLHWQGCWQATVEKRKHRVLRSSDEQLAEAERKQGEAAEESERLRAQMHEMGQRVGMLNVALREEQQAHLLAREKVEAAKQFELPAREAISKRREAERRADELSRQVQQLVEAVDKEKAGAKATAERHTAQAEIDLKRLLTEQRKALDSQMAQVRAECEQRIEIIQQKADRERQDAQQQADLYAAKFSELQSQQQQLEQMAHVQLQPGGSMAHLIHGRAPHLNTQDRAKVWDQQIAEKEAAGLKPWDPWAEGFKTASAFRAVRKMNSTISMGLGGSSSGGSKMGNLAVALQAQAAQAKLTASQASVFAKAGAKESLSVASGSSSGAGFANGLRSMVASQSTTSLAAEAGAAGPSKQASPPRAEHNVPVAFHVPSGLDAYSNSKRPMSMDSSLHSSRHASPQPGALAAS